METKIYNSFMNKIETRHSEIKGMRSHLEEMKDVEIVEISISPGLTKALLIFADGEYK